MLYKRRHCNALELHIGAEYTLDKTQRKLCIQLQERNRTVLSFKVHGRSSGDEDEMIRWFGDKKLPRNTPLLLLLLLLLVLML